MKPSLSSVEIESYKDCQSLTEDCENVLVAGCRPLHVACGHGLIEMATFMLNNLADLHVKTIHKSLTPLQVSF